MKETSGVWSKFTRSTSSVIPCTILYLEAQTQCPVSGSATYGGAALLPFLSFYLDVQ